MNRNRPCSWIISICIYIFLYAPIVAVVIYSFNSAKYGGPWAGFSLEWYAKLFSTSQKLDAAANSLILAGTSTAISTVLGTMLGYGLVRYSFPGKQAFSWLMYFPVVVPEIVMAVSILIFYSMIHAWLGLFKLGLGTMIIAHITFQIPFVAIVVRARMAGMDPSIEEAAHDLGASNWQKFRYITLPLILPGVLAGGALAFTLSIDDFVVSYFTAGAGATTFPILIFSSVKRGVTPDVNALSTLIILVSIISTITVLMLSRNKQS
ncbi:ABC transporter permease [Opitutia bacterium ISCC 51]|nr:ABC transporter permease [Opitutae bacterium ISCC 51]QXD27606.1 ABC transporter permease [Opitutae bacterium ISCC 52]